MADYTCSVWAFIKEEFKCCSLGNCQNRWWLFPGLGTGNRRRCLSVLITDLLNWNHATTRFYLFSFFSFYFAATFVLNIFVLWWRSGKLWEFESPNLHHVLFEEWNAVAMATSADGIQLAGVSLTWSSLFLRAKEAKGEGSNIRFSWAVDSACVWWPPSHRMIQSIHPFRWNCV